MLLLSFCKFKEFGLDPWFFFKSMPLISLLAMTWLTLEFCCISRSLVSWDCAILLYKISIFFLWQNWFLDFFMHVSMPFVFASTVDHHLILPAGGYPSPLNYHFFPKSCCTWVFLAWNFLSVCSSFMARKYIEKWTLIFLRSVNEVICHGIPDARYAKNSS